MSQLDLALAADVSSRHVSFLETGRAQPSREMVLRLSGPLAVPLRGQNELLHAAGFPAAFTEPPLGGLAPAIDRALTRMLERHEPYPMVILDRRYELLRANGGALRLLQRFVADPSALAERPNLLLALFDPRLARPFVADWERTARALVTRLHRESLARPEDGRLSELLREVFRFPDVPESFRQPDFTLPSEPMLPLRLGRDGLQVAFLTTLTVFDAPQNVTLDEVRIESYFPLDEATEAACERL
jgi:transcriptional regulator with XRE-family HTH domain